MIRILLASHGTFAEGIKNALELILGRQPAVETFCAYVDKEADVKSRIHSFLQQMKPDDDWIVVTDIFGGSVNNGFMDCLKKYRFSLISGMNLPMLVELVTNSSVKPEERVNAAIDVAKGEVKNCNALFSDSRDRPEEDF